MISAENYIWTREKLTNIGKLKTKVRIETENFWAAFPDRTLIETEFTIINYKWGPFGFYECSNVTDYKITLFAYDEVSGKACNLWGSAENLIIKNYNNSEKVYVCEGWTNRFNPLFVYYNVHVLTSAGEIWASY